MDLPDVDGLPEGTILMGAVVIAQVAHQDGAMQLCIRTTNGLEHNTALGMAVTLADRLRGIAQDGWEEDED